MENVYYLVNWGTDKQKAWSGTCWGLFNALKKNCGDIEDIDLTDSRWGKLRSRLISKIKHSGSDMDLSHIKRQRRRVKRLIGNSKCTVFQFAEVLLDSESTKTYIYQDLSVDYVRYMAESLPEVFAVSNFQGCGTDAITARNESQLEYYKNCSGIFTMGKWLARDLVDRCGIPECKVYPVGGE